MRIRYARVFRRLVPSITLALLIVTAASGSVHAETFANSTPIPVEDPPPAGVADLYPSSLVVEGMTGTITDVDVVLNSVFHAFPDDLDVLLVGPTGASVLLVSDAGGVTDVAGAVIILDDEAAGVIPDAGPLSGSTFRPTNFEAAADAFPPPAPAPSGGTALTVFDGTDPNGTWSLYVVDDTNGDVGRIEDWSMQIVTSTMPAT